MMLVSPRQPPLAAQVQQTLLASSASSTSSSASPPSFSSPPQQQGTPTTSPTKQPPPQQEDFGSSYKRSASIYVPPPTTTTTTSSAAPLVPPKTRLLVFLEDAHGRRRTILDSAAAVNRPLLPTSSSSQNMSGSSTDSSSTTPSAAAAAAAAAASGVGAKSSLNNDMIIRMVMGSYPMVVSNRQDAIKVHSLKNSNKIMISNVFAFVNHRNTSHSGRSMCHHYRRLLANQQQLLQQQQMSPPSEATTAANSRRTSLSSNCSSMANSMLLSPETLLPIALTKPININTTATTGHRGSFSNASTKRQRLPFSPQPPPPAPAAAVVVVPAANANTISPTTTGATSCGSSPSSTASSSLTNNNASNVTLIERLLQQQQQPRTMSPSPAPTAPSSLLIYKRLQRSISNSLITTSTAPTSVVVTPPGTTINTASSSPLLLPKNATRYHHRQVSPSIEAVAAIVAEQPALSEMTATATSESADDERETDKVDVAANVSQQQPARGPFSNGICEKCIENSVSKYKIGMAIVFSLPLQQQQSTTNSSSYYEFFFSHLPLIEYQIKELRESLLVHLPLYFNPPPPPSSTASSTPPTPPHIMTPPTTATTASQSSSSLLTTIFSSRLLTQFKTQMKLGNIGTATTTSASSSKDSSPSPSSPHATSLYLTRRQPPASQQLQQQLLPVFSSSSFQQQLVAEFELFQQRLSLLFTTARLERPCWLALINQRRSPPPSPSSTSVCHTLVSSLVALHQRCSFAFASTLLATVLKHHLSWVYTVMPPSTPPPATSSSTALLRKQRASWCRLLERTNPYNPLWAQLGDLHGACTQPPVRLVRVCVTGSSNETLDKCLHVLSYFIRCGTSTYYDIQQQQQQEEPSLLFVDNHHLLSSSSSPSSMASSPPQQQQPGGFQRQVSIFELCQESSSSPAVSTSSSEASSPRQPTLLGGGSKRARQISSSPCCSTAVLSSGAQQPQQAARELPLLPSQVQVNQAKSHSMHDNFGYSLLAAVSDRFVFELVLHGVKTDKQQPGSGGFVHDLTKRLRFAKRHSILDCPVAECVYIVADVDTRQVRVFSSEDDDGDEAELPASEVSVPIVDAMLESVLQMAMVGAPSAPEFVMSHLEDRLQELYSKAVSLQHIREGGGGLDDLAIAKLLDIDGPSDLDFLNRILSVVACN